MINTIFVFSKVHLGFTDRVHHLCCVECAPAEQTERSAGGGGDGMVYRAIVSLYEDCYWDAASLYDISELYTHKRAYPLITPLNL